MNNVIISRLKDFFGLKSRVARLLDRLGLISKENGPYKSVAILTALTLILSTFIAAPYRASAAAVPSNKIGSSVYSFSLANTSSYSLVGGIQTANGQLDNGSISGYPEGSCLPIQAELTNNSTQVGDINFSLTYDYSDSVVGVDRLEALVPTVSGNPRITADNLNDFNYTKADLSTVNQYGSTAGINSAVITGPYGTNVSGSVTPISPTDTSRHYNVSLTNVPAGTTVYMIFCARLGLDASEYPPSSISVAIPALRESFNVSTNKLLALPSITVSKSIAGAQGPATAFEFNLSPDVNGHTGSYSVAPGGSITIDNVSPDGNFAITEVDDPDYDFVSVSGTNCIFASGATATASVSAGGTATNAVCNFTNSYDPAPTHGSVTITKVVVNDNGGDAEVSDFVLSVGNEGVTSGVAEDFLPGQYQISELGVGYDGIQYASSFSGDCTVNGMLTVVAGQSYECTITNDDVVAQLMVIKVVDNGDSETPLSVSDFPLFVDQTPVTSGASNSFNAGSYTVSETNQPSYSAVFTGSCNALGLVTLILGDDKTCTITNIYNRQTPETGKVTVIKQVVNDEGGTKSASDFTINVNGFNVSRTSFPGDEQGTEVTMEAGEYNIVETKDFGYTATYSDDCSGTMIGGAELTCTIINNDSRATSYDIVVNKVVSNATADTGQTISYTITAQNNGLATASGVVLSDSLPSGLAYVSDSGGDATTVTDNDITWTVGDLATGQSVILTITATVNEGTEGQSLINTASITCDQENDLDCTNNTATATTQVNNPGGGSSGGGGGGSVRRGKISGTSYIDIDRNGKYSVGDTPIEGVTVYIDSNDNGQLNTGEDYEVTDEDGNYEFDRLREGTYYIREVVPTGYTVTEPSQSALYIVESDRDSISDRDFGHVQLSGNLPPGQVLGDVTTVPSGAVGSQLPRTGAPSMLLLAILAVAGAIVLPRKAKLIERN